MSAPLTVSTLARVIGRLARAVAAEADAIAREDSSATQQWVDQASSPLGRRVHCRVARERLAAGEGGAMHVGRRYYLSPEAIEEFGGRPRPANDEALDDYDAEAEIDAVLRGVGGGK